MSKCVDILTLIKTPSKSPSKLVKLGHTRRYGAHFEDLDEAHPSKVLQEAISLHFASNSKKNRLFAVSKLCQNVFCHPTSALSTARKPQAPNSVCWP
jgi:hypothetical protein